MKEESSKKKERKYAYDERKEISSLESAAEAYQFQGLCGEGESNVAKKWTEYMCNVTMKKCL